MGLTPNYAWPLPEMSDPANVPADLKELGDAIDASLKTTQIANPPVGALLLWPSAVAPLNFLICIGQQVDALDYPDLGTILGVAAGKVTIPDLRNRFPVGVGSDYAMNAVGGEKTHVLAAGEMPAHTHAATGLAVASHTHGPGTLATDTEAAHAHSFGGKMPRQLGGTSVWIGQQANVFDPVWDAGGMMLARVADGNVDSITGVATAGAHAHTVSGGATAAVAPAVSGATASVGGGTAHENRPPYLALNFIIRAR